MRHFKLILLTLSLLIGSASMRADIIQFGSLEDTEWAATADDGCSNGSTIVLDGVVVTFGSAEDSEVTWSWHAKNAGLLPSQMPSTDGTAESLITSFSDSEPFGELPTHGAFFKIQPSRPGIITFRGKASANAAQPMIFVTCPKDDQTIIAAEITPWDANVTEWTYEVDTEHDYYFFQQSYPGQLSGYRLTFRGVAFEATGDAPPPVDQRNVGFLYNGDLAADLAYKVISGDRSNKVTAIEANKVFTLEDFADYEVITISSTVTNDEAIASLKEVHPFLPVLNLNPRIYEKWGYGEVVDAGIQFATTRNPNHPLFRNLPLIEDPDAEEPTFVLELSNETSFPGLHLSGIFANDPILAVAYENEDVVAIHSHSLSRNGYLYIPYTQETLSDASTPELLLNAIALMNGTKQPAPKAPLPTFALEYDYKATIVSIADAAPGAEIFYTLDGSMPTEESMPYTGPFIVDQELTVMAVARGEGYLVSDVAERYIDIRLVCPPPVFTMERQDGSTIVTISSELEGASIYYNYKGDNTTSKSTLYTGPITFTNGRTIYAFQTCPEYLNSKVGSAEVPVTNPRVRVDILSKMDANQDEYYSYTLPETQTDNTGFFFSWGNTICSIGPEEVVDLENGWSLRSRGQRIAWENVSPAFNYGDDVSSSFNPKTVEDEDAYLPVTSGLIDLYDWDTAFPANAIVQTTQAFAGPFDVVAYAVNENGNIGFGDTSATEWTATSGDACNNGSTITLEGVVVTLGSPDDTDVSWSWHAGNAGLLPTQMPSTDGTAETLITEFSEEEPFGTLPTHGAFFKIEPSKAGILTIRGKASASAAQPLVFVTLDKNNPAIILSAMITPWDASVTEWSYEVDADHVYIFFQLAYPEKLNGYRFTLRGMAFEAYEQGGSGESGSEISGDLAAKLVIEVAESNTNNAVWTQLGETLVLPDARRLYRKFVRSYESATPVLVRTRIINNVGRAGIFNIYLANEGEVSKRIIQEQMTGIANMQSAVSLPAGIYSVSGVRQNEMQRGLNIIVTSEGKIKKVFVR